MSRDRDAQRSARLAAAVSSPRVVLDPVETGADICGCCEHAFTRDNPRLMGLDLCDVCGGCPPGGCIRNRCRCPGGCCADHEDGKQCADTAKILIGFIGQIVREVCLDCAVEIAKKSAGL